MAQDQMAQPSLVEADGIEAERAVFAALGTAYPSGQVSLSFAMGEGDQAGRMLVTFHQNLGSQGPGNLLGVFVPLSFHPTRRSAFVDMAMSSQREQIGGRRAAMVAGYFESESGPVYAVLEAVETVPIVASEMLPLCSVNIRHTTRSQTTATKLARADATRWEAESAAAWIDRGMPEAALPLVQLDGTSMGELVVAPPMAFRPRPAPVVVPPPPAPVAVPPAPALPGGPPDPQPAESCFKQFSWGKVPYENLLLPTEGPPGAVRSADFWVDIKISCKSCVGVPLQLSQICDPRWHIQFTPMGDLQRGRYRVRIKHEVDEWSVPSPNPPCRVQLWMIRVDWSIEAVELPALKDPVFSPWAVQPVAIFWADNAMCVKSVTCTGQ